MRPAQKNGSDMVTLIEGRQERQLMLGFEPIGGQGIATRRGRQRGPDGDFESKEKLVGQCRGQRNTRLANSGGEKIYNQKWQSGSIIPASHCSDSCVIGQVCRI